MAPGLVNSEFATPSYRHEGIDTIATMPAPAPVKESGSKSSFLQNWTNSIQPRLEKLLAVLGGQEVAKSLVLGQIWTYLPVFTENKQMLKAESICLIGAADLQEFHSRCCHEGVQLNQLGPMGKVWESGVVQVVQNAENLSIETHPCNRLSFAGGLAKIIGEIVYLPVYDVTPDNGNKGVVAVLELMMSARTHDVMVVANMISTVSVVMEGLQLSLSMQPTPALQQHNKLERISAPHSMEAESKVHQQEQQNLAGSWPGQALSGMSRTVSLRALHNF